MLRIGDFRQKLLQQGTSHKIIFYNQTLHNLYLDLIDSCELLSPNNTPIQDSLSIPWLYPALHKQGQTVEHMAIRKLCRLTEEGNKPIIWGEVEANDSAR